LVPATALADSAFILPSITNLAGQNNVVTFDAAASDHLFYMDHRALQLASIKITRPDGTVGTTENGIQGRLRSVFDVRVDAQGTWKIASEQSMINGSFMLDGEERRVGGRGGPPRPPGAEGSPAGSVAPAAPPPPGPGGPAGGEGPRRAPPVAFQDIPATATDIHLVENINRVETFVTVGAPTTTVFTPTGRGLEFQPITHPNAIAAGEVARFRFLIDGRPAAGIKVTVIQDGDRYREQTDATELTTGADGTFGITWPNAGRYWVSAQAEDTSPSERRAEKRRMSYSATLEVATP